MARELYREMLSQGASSDPRLALEVRDARLWELTADQETTAAFCLSLEDIQSLDGPR